MFTGIIERQGVVISMTEGMVPRLIIDKPELWEFKVGGSIAVDGVCLTVIEQTTNSFTADVLPETIERTTLKYFNNGRTVNIERPLRMGDEIGGHIVQGHVDTRIKVIDINRKESSCEIKFSFPEKYKKYVIEKRSVAINGVSLTIARIDKDVLTVALIPHTLQHTNLGGLKIGDEVNVEFDTFIQPLAPNQKK
ncbi:riboflavin synthase [Candidatus Nomurabacteria bacterium]|nr:riboflavin synthase [Candidatus Kaiserbacteria bacterium]MCB9814978.1 riboflavin synthase [Candidatus Nomurabacteria bacterium]